MIQTFNTNQDKTVTLKINAVKADACSAGISAKGLVFNKV
jgi:hypothetical protein